MTFTDTLLLGILSEVPDLCLRFEAKDQLYGKDQYYYFANHHLQKENCFQCHMPPKLKSLLPMHYGCIEALLPMCSIHFGRCPHPQIQVRCRMQMVCGLVGQSLDQFIIHHARQLAAPDGQLWLDGKQHSALM